MCVQSAIDEGISRGLAISRKFLTLMSEEGLHRVKNSERDEADHKNDWVLKEYQLAISISEQRGVDFLIPVFVGNFTSYLSLYIFIELIFIMYNE